MTAILIRASMAPPASIRPTISPAAAGQDFEAAAAIKKVKPILRYLLQKILTNVVSFYKEKGLAEEQVTGTRGTFRWPALVVVEP